MKPFQFMEEEYQDLNQLGYAFIQNFDLAIEAIQTKKFLRFIKHFKAYKKRIPIILYENRYLENALTCIIYEITVEHILYVGKKKYIKLTDIFKDIHRESFQLFIKDEGFSNTILPTLEDEKLKLNLKSLEKNYEDSFSYQFISKYYEYDSIEDLSMDYRGLSDTKDPYQFLTHLLQKEDYLLRFGHKYDLETVLQIRKNKSAFVLAAEALKEELPQELIQKVLDEAFYLKFFDHIDAYKYKGAEAKQIYKSLKAYRKVIKKLPKYDFNSYIKAHQDIYRAYLSFVNAFKQEKIQVKGDIMDYIVDIPYCSTYIWKAYVIDTGVKADDEYKEYTPEVVCSYDVNKFQKSIKNHTFFGRWTIVFSIIHLIVLGGIFALLVLGMGAAVLALAFLKIANPSADISVTTNENFNKIMLIFIMGVAASILSLFCGIFFLIKKGQAKKKYRRLCKLAYYRKNKESLTEKQVKDYEMIVIKEDQYARTIDRFYRFYGGVSNACLAISTCVTVLCFLNILIGANEAYALGLDSILSSLDKGITSLFLEGKFYFLFIPALIVFLLGILRHKKTAWSCIFTVILSMGLSIALVYVVQMM